MGWCPRTRTRESKWGNGGRSFSTRGDCGCGLVMYVVRLICTICWHGCVGQMLVRLFVCFVCSLHCPVLFFLIHPLIFCSHWRQRIGHWIDHPHSIQLELAQPFSLPYSFSPSLVFLSRLSLSLAPNSRLLSLFSRSLKALPVLCFVCFVNCPWLGLLPSLTP